MSAFTYIKAKIEIKKLLQSIFKYFYESEKGNCL